MSEVLRPERWAKLEAIFAKALSLEPSQRQAFLMQVCAGDEALRREVESLLQADDVAAADFLQSSPFSLGLKIMVDEENRSNEMSWTKMKLGDRYEILGAISDGGMGNVYRARDTRVSNKIVAVKVLQEKWLQEEYVVAKFRQEAAVLAKLDDPGIVGILDAGALPSGQPWIVMQFVEGETLSHFISSGKMELADVAEIIRQIGRTLTIAHEAGVSHRDLKPSNIMLRRNTGGDWQVRIIDFGIAKVIGAAQETTQFPVGTPLYMSPEQHNVQEITPASDIYALGLIAYELLTGARPFKTNNVNELPSLQQSGIKTKPSELRPGLSSAVDDVIGAALNPAPHQRPATAREFSDALYGALAGASAAVRIQPHLIFRFQRKPWVTYSIRDGYAHTEGGLIWRRSSSIPLAGSSIKLGFGSIRITHTGGAKQKWSKVPNARRVYDALVRVSKGLPLTDLKDDAPSHIFSFIAFIVWSSLTIAAWFFSATIPWLVADMETIAKQAEPAVVLTLILALLAGGLAAICVALGNTLRSGRSWLKLEPQPLDFEAFSVCSLLGRLLQKVFGNSLLEAGSHLRLCMF